MNFSDYSWNDFFKEIQNEDFCQSLNKFLNNEYAEYNQWQSVFTSPS